VEKSPLSRGADGIVLASGIQTSIPAPSEAVVHLITGLGMGGAEMVLAQLARSARRHRHVVVSLGSEGYIGPQLEAAGISVCCLGLNRAAGLTTFVPRLARILHRERPRAIQGWLAHGNLVATIGRALSGFKVPLLWNVRQSLSDLAHEKRSTQMLIRFNARISNQPATIVYNSYLAAAQHEMIGYSPERRLIIANGFDLQRFAPSAERRRAARESLGIADEDILVGLIGRFHPTKNHAAFFAAASRIAETERNVRFLVAGPGVVLDNPDLRAMIPDPRILERCLLLGPRDDLPALYNAMDIACSVSLGESFSNTLGEAMASGVPCITTNSGDSARIVGDSGIVCADAGPQAIAAAICAMIRAGGAQRGQLGKIARARMEARYSLEAMLASYDNLYDEVPGRS
jgi:glycosyltransferase involved in cell wall biosynthesis